MYFKVQTIIYIEHTPCLGVIMLYVYGDGRK